MYILLALVFVLAYVMIALEDILKISKTAVALFAGVGCWTILSYWGGVNNLDHQGVDSAILSVMGETASLLFYLMGAMTVVELVDKHGGFEAITNLIRTRDKRILLWSVAWGTFFLSSVLDNLATTIVMVTLLRKLLDDEKELWLYASFVVLAANAGGAFSPIGDVSTILLWVGGQVTAKHIILELFLPSVVCLMVPLIFVTFRLKGEVKPMEHGEDQDEIFDSIRDWEKHTVMAMGISALIFVPIFKAITGLPPFLGILFALAVMWVFTEFIHKKKEDHVRAELSITSVLQKVDSASILYFLGIFLAVGAMQHSGHLADLATLQRATFGDDFLSINILTGLLSSVVDNSALVAGAKAMYPLTVFHTDHHFWELLAYCAGTGGSCLIIGSAAGVAAMGLLKIDFFWYMKNISFYALLGYFAGILIFVIEDMII